jgi:hypothetical protein
MALKRNQQHSYDTGMNLFGFHELLGIFRLAEHVSPYQEVLASAKLAQQLMSRTRKHGSTIHNLAVIV